MRKLLLIPLGAVLFLSGCMYQVRPPICPPIDDATCRVELASPAGVIHRPLISSGDDWYVEPLNRRVLHFGTGRDQYGSPVGLSDDTAWVLRSIQIRCSLKDWDDTLFYPPYRPGVLHADGHDNSGVWYPTWTAKIEPISGMPVPLTPEVGYPWSSCQNLETKYAPSQSATIIAKAEAKYVDVVITCPDMGTGHYLIDIPGRTPQVSNSYSLRLSEPGEYKITWTDGNSTMTYSAKIPIDWFWISAQFTIPVGPMAGCS